MVYPSVRSSTRDMAARWTTAQKKSVPYTAPLARTAIKRRTSAMVSTILLLPDLSERGRPPSYLHGCGDAELGGNDGSVDWEMGG